MQTVKITTALFVFLLLACGSGEKPEQAKPANPDGLTDFQMENGIGPVTEKLNLGEINPEMAKAGEETFKVKCASCHKLDERFVGPAQRYTADRRSPEYILNMILNPDEMTKRHPTAKKLLAEYLAPMTNMNLTVQQAKEVLEYFRTVAKEGHEKNITAVPVFRNQQ